MLRYLWTRPEVLGWPPTANGALACEKAVHKLCDSWVQDIGVAAQNPSLRILAVEMGLSQP